MTFLFLPNRGIFAEFNAYKVKLPIVYQGIPWKKKKGCHSAPSNLKYHVKTKHLGFSMSNLMEL